MWELNHKESWAPKSWCFWIVVLEKTLESPLDCKTTQPIHPKGDQSWVFIGRTDVEAEAPILWPPDAKNWLIGKDPDAGKDWRQEEKGTTEDETVGWLSLTRWTWVWASSRSWWWTGKPGMLQSMRSQTVWYDWATELNGTEDWKAKGGKSWAENGSPEVDKVNRVEHSLIGMGINQNWSSRSAEVKECWMKCNYTNPQKDWRSVMNQLILPVICFYANYLLLESKSKSFLDFPGGTEDKNPCAKAGDMGSIPGPGTFHMPQSNKACVPQLMSPRARAHGLQQEKPPQWEACALQRRAGPGSPQLEKALTKQGDLVLSVKYPKWLEPEQAPWTMEWSHMLRIVEQWHKKPRSIHIHRKPRSIFIHKKARAPNCLYLDFIYKREKFLSCVNHIYFGFFVMQNQT